MTNEHRDRGHDWTALRSAGLTLTTFHVGSRRSLVVLRDWIDFFGPRATNVRVVSSTGISGCFSRSDFEEDFPSAELVDLEPRGQKVTELDCIGVYKAIAEAPTDWVAIVKLDTLPYAEGDGLRWLDRAIDRASDRGCWGITAFRTHRCRYLDDEFAETQSFSQNLAVVSGNAWKHLFRSTAPELLERVVTRRVEAKDRYLMEDAIERGLARHGWWNLRLVDRDDLFVFHVNQWGDPLLAIRDRFRARDGVRPFFNGPRPRPSPAWTLPPWTRYYGLPRPSLWRRLRCTLGRWRRQILSSD